MILEMLCLSVTAAKEESLTLSDQEWSVRDPYLHVVPEIQQEEMKRGRDRLYRVLAQNPRHISAQWKSETAPQRPATDDPGALRNQLWLWQNTLSAAAYSCLYPLRDTDRSYSHDLQHNRETVSALLAKDIVHFSLWFGSPNGRIMGRDHLDRWLFLREDPVIELSVVCGKAIPVDHEHADSLLGQWAAQVRQQPEQNYYEQYEPLEKIFDSQEKDMREWYYVRVTGFSSNERITSPHHLQQQTEYWQYFREYLEQTISATDIIRFFGAWQEYMSAAPRIEQ